METGGAAGTGGGGGGRTRGQTIVAVDGGKQ